MATNRVNGHLFEKMLKNGLANLCLQEKKINSLNVFPVADGDTGTNMRLTLENGIRNAKSNSELCVYLKSLNEGLLLGARGNSGVIFSQLFNGMYQFLSRCSAATPRDMRGAFVKGYRTAYSAVACPTEGTILTVAREGIEYIRDQMDRTTTIEAMFAMYLAEMKKSLKRTPELLPVLRSAGVIDSGALGYITVIEGMLKYLYGEKIETDSDMSAAFAETGNAASGAELSHFDENSNFEQGYCMEFILQLMRAPKYMQNFRLSSYIDNLKLCGNSIVAVEDGSRVKVHIHTHKPAQIILLSQEFGEFLTFKLENMQLQHNEQLKKKEESVKCTVKAEGHRTLAVIAVVNGEGMNGLFLDLGCAAVIDGGPHMNVSSEEFIKAFDKLDADRIAVLPNNKNTYLAAKQAIELWDKSTPVDVIETADMAQGYFTIAMDISPVDDLDKRVSQLKDNSGIAGSLSVAQAKKDYRGEGVDCIAGQWVALIKDKIAFAADDPIDAFIGGLQKLEDIDDKETCIVFGGNGSDPEIEAKLEAAVNESFPSLEVSFVSGGQKVYKWISGLI